MIVFGAIIFYVGFFGLFVGVIGLIKGSLENLKIYNRKQVMKVIGLSIVLIMAGALIVGPESNHNGATSDLSLNKASHIAQIRSLRF